MSLIIRKLQLPFLRGLFDRPGHISRVELGYYARPMAYGPQQGSRRGEEIFVEMSTLRIVPGEAFVLY